jgi:hypothetical protein
MQQANPADDAWDRQDDQKACNDESDGGEDHRSLLIVCEESNSRENDKNETADKDAEDAETDAKCPNCGYVTFHCDFLSEYPRSLIGRLAKALKLVVSAFHHTHLDECSFSPSLFHQFVLSPPTPGELHGREKSILTWVSART